MNIFSAQENKILLGSYKIQVILWLAGISVGVTYLILPWYTFLTIFSVSCLIYIISKKIEYGYYLILLSIAVERIFLVVHLRDVDFFILPHIFFLLLTLLVWTVSTHRQDSERREDLSIYIILVTVVIYESFSLLWAQSLTLGLMLVFSLFFNFSLFYLAIAILKDNASLKRLARVWVVIGIIVATGVILSQWLDYEEKIGLNKYLTLKLAFGEITNRAAGFGGPAHEAGFLVFPIFILIGNLFASDSFSKKLFHLLIMGYLIVGLIVTASRGALIGMLGGVLLLFLIHPFAKSKFIRYSLLFTFLVSLTILIAKPSYIDRIMVGFGYSGQLYFSDEGNTYATSSDTSKLSGMKQRISWWETALNKMQDRPYKLLLGLGVGSFIIYTKAFGTHSVPLSFFFDMGLTGAILLIFLVIILYKKFSYYIKYGRLTYCYYIFIVSVAAFVGDVGIHGLMDYDLSYYGSKMFWFPLGYVCALLNIMKSENPQLEG